jgi:nucleotide-binding universal stress UspA family protein
LRSISSAAASGEGGRPATEQTPAGCVEQGDGNAWEDAMPFNDILVAFDSTDAGDERFDLAIRLARAHDARLTGVHPFLDSAVEAMLFPMEQPAMAAVGPEVGTVAPAPGAGDHAAAGLAEQGFYDALRRHGLRGEFRPLDGANPAELCDLAKFADLVILGQYDRGGRARAVFRPDEVTLACGRPTLIVPYAGRFPTVGDRVVIAWDGSREAVRALHDAIPLMVVAEAVTVLTVMGHESERKRVQAGLGRVVGHLEQHGIAAQFEVTLRGELGVSDILLSRAADLGVDLIVAGAYHHSPYREALFGGVTHDLLDHMTVPVVMSH